MKIKPLYRRVLVERIEAQEKSKGGIIIPETAKEKPAEGRVISTGDGRDPEGGARFDFDVKKGDRVLFGKYAGNEVKLDGKEHVFLREDEILAVIEG
ncbi:MAG: co-chaperone GroES [Deltaproteobacteria bacterium]|nr:co-chaperone GroES [Deltaproteobacteria bacterium]